ncbi:nitrogenase iron-molybdenum cofactor biosynthesis protein NifE [Clostridium pasteurianum DSM 525 = ATCC 6013]|uniref:Nitrogenase iron-molybdenum cofactor biosynthesis protein NifE n=1 Tax=Clostridium pasteurianum DSM 525 = ATCC 6013 TaxID=1262449 RepID=A0A0H3JBB3_CLOPA|nr:nitrogenase component 1 [Clostridium pasteurianum]AJA49430.1 nitrogenase iron-molybdenum cofactor biosynthesis protein NifE [Clostridium pasteurianum DSM 525 = ATCC 6013]AJA53418.1 nitrogenase iron-molybdenum cofactor biosynthesis protein NifE [Clostridium pasteurianum DSM 525 = ATCC 6013]AOZ76598.1 nitrogenase [Clostridium pasteurianum DSM 525 = ATCC 6013]AOZ80395.1 nitrogenase [Clostridium pasteurianum]ELP58454.1 nitrogenase molybdenum-iron protein, alpha and beta chains [Clostridium past
MTINIKRIEAVTREGRLGSITGYTGTIKDLVKKAKTGCLKNKERCFSQATNCSSGCAQGYLARIMDSAIVNHGAKGCSADVIGENTNFLWGQNIRDLEKRNVNVINTNMTEETTVFGGLKKLRDAIWEAYRRFSPKAIFITTSCASAIIGDDVKSVADEIEAQINIPVVPVFCEGFRSKIWASGFDAAFHALLTRIVKPPKEKHPEIINMLTFNGSGRDYVAEILSNFGLVPKFGIPFSTIEDISKMSESAATMSICGTLGSYFGNGLEQKYGVPYIRSLQPHGIAGMDNWLRELGKVVGKVEEIEEYIKQEKEKIAPELEEIKEKLKGKTAVVGMGPSFSHNYIRVLGELGIKVIWGASWHFDQEYDHGSIPESTIELSEKEYDTPISVCDQQNFEILNLLNKLKPDLYLSRHPGTTVWPTKMGIPSVMVADEFSAFGYRGIIDLGYRIIDALANNNLALSLSKRVKLPYTSWWFQQDTFKFLEDEVK